MKAAVYLSLTAILLHACNKPHVYEEFITIPAQTWNSNNILHFNVNITDTVRAHNLLISVRNTGKYEYSNLYLFITAHSPDGTTLRDTMEVMLADERGKWLGKGAASIYTHYQPYKSNVRFPLHGIYTFDIEQAMWIKELKYISDIGIKVEVASD
jgi:gliding motility-associated lipoprotein GldH